MHAVLLFFMSKLVVASPCLLPSKGLMHPEVDAHRAQLVFSNSSALELTNSQTKKAELIVNANGASWKGKRVCTWDDPKSEYRRLKSCPKAFPIQTSQVSAYGIGIFLAVDSYKHGVASVRYKGDSLEFKVPDNLARTLYPSEASQRDLIAKAMQDSKTPVAQPLDTAIACIKKKRKDCFPPSAEISSKQVLPIFRHRKYPYIRFATEETRLSTNELEVVVRKDKIYIDDPSCYSAVLELMDDGWHITQVFANGA